MKDMEKEEAYLRWKNWNLDSDDFEPLNDGPLIRDVKTGLVWDSTEFQLRSLEEEAA